MGMHDMHRRLIDKMMAAKGTLKHLVSSLPANCYFNVVSLAYGHRFFWKQSQPNDDSSREQFTALLEEVSASGQTQQFARLKLVYETPPLSGYVRQIFILTDGQVDREADILVLVDQRRGSQKAFSLGIGTDVARAFIEEIATRLTGNAVFVEPSDVGEAAMEHMRHALKPAVASVEVHVSDDYAFEMSPFLIPPLFSGSITHTFLKKAHAAGDFSVLVNGQSGQETYESLVSVTPVPEHIHMGKLYAFYNIKDLQDRIPLASPEEARQLKDTIVSLSQTTKILSDFTAMFTVLEGASMHFIPSLGQDQFMQPFTQGQCRGQECFRGQDEMMLLSISNRTKFVPQLTQEACASGACPTSTRQCRIVTILVAAFALLIIVAFILLGIFVF
jgi:hypothetical protein